MYIDKRDAIWTKPPEKTDHCLLFTDDFYKKGEGRVVSDPSLKAKEGGDHRVSGNTQLEKFYVEET